MFVSTTREAIAARTIAFPLRRTQQHIGVTHFEKLPHEQRRHLVRREYILWMRKVLDELL
jgi:hypothetical protein